MKLNELNPSFVGSGGVGITDSDGNPVPRREGIGIVFDCPCGDGECPRVFVAFSAPLDGGPPSKGSGPLWARTGEEFDVLTLTPSIKRISHCGWHGFVREGQIETV